MNSGVVVVILFQNENLEWLLLQKVPFLTALTELDLKPGIVYYFSHKFVI